MTQRPRCETLLRKKDPGTLHKKGCLKMTTFFNYI